MTTISAIQNTPPTLPPLTSHTDVRKSLDVSSTSTIEKMPPSNPDHSGLFSAPALTSPTFSAPILLLMDLVEETYKIGNFLLQSTTQQLQYFSDSLKKKMSEQMEVLQKAASRAQAMDVWSTLQRVGAAVFSATNLFLGYSAYESSPTLATGLIASGILSATNLLMAELKGWDQIAEIFAQGNEEFKKQLAYWPPLAITCLSGVLSATSGSSLLLDPSLVPSSYFDSTIPNFCMQAYKSVTTAGSTITGAMFSWTEAEVTAIQNAIFSDVSLQEALTSWMQSFLELMEHGREQARKIIQLTSQLQLKV